jgi:DNA mismatch repair protein MutS2
MGMLSKQSNAISDKLMVKLTAHFGDQERVFDSLRNGDVDKIAQVQGISSQRALSLARQFIGGADSFLATKEASRLYELLMKDIQSHCATNAAKKRIQLFMPLADQSERIAHSSAAMKIDFQTLIEIKGIMENLRTFKEPNKRYDRVVVSRNPLPSFEGKCRIYTPSEEESWKDYTVFAKVTWLGQGAPMDAPEGWIVLPEDVNDFRILPEYIIDWFQYNVEVIKTMLKLIEHCSSITTPNLHFETILQRKQESEGLEKFLTMLSSLGQEDVLEGIRDHLWKKAKSIEQEMHDEVTLAIQHQSVALQGEELLEALSNNSSLKRKLQSATSEIIEDAVEHAHHKFSSFLEPAGIQCPLQLFSEGWPAVLNKSELDEIHSTLTEMIESNATQKIVTLAVALQPFMQKAKIWMQDCIELDIWMSIGRWSTANGCSIPTFCEHGLAVEDAFHLFIDGTPEPVTYALGTCAPKGDQQNLALLTGANSGGKTTLLETLSFVVILAHMGLPVPAKSAIVARVESLHVLAKAGGTQSAGALEQTLEQLARVVSDEAPKIIFADELEAITEPGAGAKIIAGMLLAAEQQENTTTVLVTHLAPAILQATGRHDLRVDGIEARGLDEHLELVVDRNPRRNYLAQSTPELILRRLHQRNSGAIEALFGRILNSFD